ncbi:hypothetical protein FA15DRAFT_112932 [Coprinopsis marcescibilis]|uniref:Uncharacterized protein n=1 Tax=Coprinopsis marcescibilis TaxID=230819 RepID=A0A5C3KK75_COPMA|nr:hypothetical protein FA15DRAFT_112932 [Coprinopsis marcescibilis]
MPGLVAAPTTNTVAHGDRASHTQPGPTSFVIRRLNTSQLIQESELLLDDGQRHIHALRTIAPGVRATLYVEQAEDNPGPKLYLAKSKGSPITSYGGGGLCS